MEGMHVDHTMDPMDMEDYGDESGAMVSDIDPPHLNYLPVTFSNPRAKPLCLTLCRELLMYYSRVMTRMSH